MVEHHKHVVGDGEIEIDDTELEDMLPVVCEHADEVAELEKELSVSPLSPLEMQIAEEKLNNVAHKAIAKRLGVTDKVVRVVLGRQHVKKYIKDVFESVTAADKEQRMQLMAALIEQKMAEEGITSKLDLAQLIQMLDSMGKVAETAQVGSQGSVMINILNNIKRISMARKDTREEVIQKFISIHGSEYNYENVIYTTSGSPVEIGCLEHGMFWQQPRTHISGSGCPKCGHIKTAKSTKLSQTDVIKAFNYIHNNEYDYSLIKYVNDNTKVEIICSKHGNFWQLPYNHKIGNKCPKCANDVRAKINRDNSTGWSYTNWHEAGKISENFDSFKVYIIKCFNDHEEFYKIGKTFQTVDSRFAKGLSYQYEIVKIIEGEAREISELEKELHKIHKEHQYIPSIEFSGMYECFSEIKEESIAN